MRILDINNNEITSAECDLTVGYLTVETIIKSDATPIDNETKFAYEDEDYEDIQRYRVVPEEQRYQSKIDELKNKLSATDYVVIKIAEGAAKSEEYKSIIDDRAKWRLEINELQEKLKKFLDAKYLVIEDVI